MTRKRSDGAMIRLIVPVEEGESIEEGDQELLQMMSRMDSFLPKYVPN